MSGEMELFTTRVRKSTRKIHSMSDALVNAKFAISLRDESVWGGGLYVFYHIFAYLEDAKERINIPEYNSLFITDELFRKKAFELDLEYYLGSNWRYTEKSPALHKYLQHLQEIEKNNPKLLMAYVYHLYLGLLSGGQILAKKRAMFDDKNSSSYKDKVTDFSQVDISKLKRDFKDAMNEISSKMSEEEKVAFIEESNRVFMLNNSIVNAISGQNEIFYSTLLKFSIITVVLLGSIIAYKMQK